MKTKLWAIILVFLCTFFTSTAQLLYKYAVPHLSLSLEGILLNFPLLLGIGLYAIGAVLFVVSFRGGEVSTLFPIIAMGYIWVTLLSYFFLGETINPAKILGILSIVFGISFVGFGARSEHAS